MNTFRTTLAALVVISCSYESCCLIKHCDPETDAKREKLLKDLPKLNDFLQNDGVITKGRLGEIKFIDWQDQLLHLTAPKNIKCLWRMSSPSKAEADKFNEKAHMGSDLYGDPIDIRHYVHLVSCETDECIQYFNLISRPIAKPDFPVQQYEGYAKDVSCDLSLMTEKGADMLLRAPFEFEWTGPRDCSQANWDEKSDKCVRYKFPDKYNNKSKTVCKTCDGCSFKMDKDYLEQMKVTRQPSYPTDTEIEIKGKLIKGPSNNGTEIEVETAFSTTLKIKKADMRHDGTWRCIVYDKHEVSSDSLKRGHAHLKDQEVKQRGIVEIHIKTLWFAIGIPIGIVVGTIVISLLCILLCKQCTDFDADPDEVKNKPKENLKISNQSNVASKTASNSGKSATSVAASVKPAASTTASVKSDSAVPASNSSSAIAASSAGAPPESTASDDDKKKKTPKKKKH